MRRALQWVGIVALWGVPPMHAQNPDAQGPERADQLRQQVEGRFAERVKERLQLSDDQMTRLRGTARTYGARRRDLAERERGIRAALAEQLQPGAAADQDSVSRLTDALVAIRDSHAHALRDENRELAEYLTPVQRSQLFVMRERLVRRAREIREERQGEVGPRPPRAGERGRSDPASERPRARRARPDPGRP
jgi:DNA anti-recombination protein RmuC